MLRRSQRELFVSQKDQPFGFFPADTPVGDRKSVLELAEVGRETLASRLQVTFEHQSDDVLVSLQSLSQAIVPADVLQSIIFVGIRMAAIDHQARRQTGGV